MYMVRNVALRNIVSLAEKIWKDWLKLEKNKKMKSFFDNNINKDNNVNAKLNIIDSKVNAMEKRLKLLEAIYKRMKNEQS